jgi:hypothetical protein
LLRGEIDWRYLSRGVTHYSGLNDAEWVVSIKL